MTRRVCIVGAGVVSPLGADRAAFDEALFAGRSALRAEPLVLPGNDPVTLAVGRCEFDERAVNAPSRLPLDRASALALQSADAAMVDAGLADGGVDPLRLGLYWGSGMGGAATFEATCRGLYADHRRIRPSSVVTSMPNAALAELAVRYGVRGAALGYACACASAAVAIGEALLAIRHGRLDVALVGGSEALLVPGVMGAWQAMRVLAPVGDRPAFACRPFAADRAGFALGEGAAALVLEAEPHARARGRRPWVALSGYASMCDGFHVTQPAVEGQVRTLQAALADAGLPPQAIGHVNAHGTATVAGDAAEAASLQAVFGSRQPAVTATKAAIGHLLGAGGAVELIATLSALERGVVPPTGHAAPVDPALEIDLVQGEPRHLPDLRHAISNSFAFGGTNAVLVASRID